MQRDRVLAVVGAGDHSAVVYDCATSMAQWAHIEFFDDKLPPRRKIAALEAADPVSFDVFVAIGDNVTRRRIGQALLARGFAIPIIAHASAMVSPSAVLGPGTVVMPNGVVNAASSLGAFCIVNTAATIDHHCRLGPAVHVAPGAHLAGRVTIGAQSLIGIGATVRQNIVIGDDVTVGAGAAVVANVPNGRTVVGVPAQ